MPETILLCENEGQGNEGLEIAADLIFNQVYKRANLPKLLANVAMAGHKAEALEALIAWGTGKRSIDDLWEEICPMAQKNSVMEGVVPIGKKEVTE